MSGTVRYGPSQSIDSVLADLRSLLDNLEVEIPGLKTTVVKQFADERPSMLPFEMEKSAPIVNSVRKAFKSVRDFDQQIGPVKPYCFYGTDAAHLQSRAAMPGIVCGPGGRYNTMPDERVDIIDYLDAIRIYLLTILDVCEGA